MLVKAPVRHPLPDPHREGEAWGPPRTPGRPWPVRLLDRAWRELRKMRTAIILLVILAAMAMVGTLLPQIPQNPRAVMLYVLAHPVTAPWFARLGLFDIFSSWLFIAVATLMYVSIGAGLYVRVPAAWRRTLPDRRPKTPGPRPNPFFEDHPCHPVSRVLAFRLDPRRARTARLFASARFGAQ